jgi:large subunit ribosomal protein L18e
MIQNNLRLKMGRGLENHSKKSKQRIWKDVSETLLSPRKNRSSVNVAEISRNSKDGSKIIVAGKVLGAGSIDHKVTVAAFAFSQGAKTKIVASGGECLDIAEFARITPNVKDVLIIG